MSSTVTVPSVLRPVCNYPVGVQYRPAIAMSPDAEVCDHWPFTGSAGVADRFPVTDLQSTDERLPARDPKVQYEHIIWDWNGTLLDDLDVCVDVMNGLLTDRRLARIDVDRHREVFDFPVETYYRALGFDFSEESFGTVASDYCTRFDHRVADCRLHDDVEAVLGKIAAANARQSILSSCEQGSLIEAVRSFGLTGHFGAIVGQADQHAKGKVAAGADLLARAAAPRQRTLLVGDTLHDYAVAKALGIDCILVSLGHHSTSRLTTECESVVESLADVIAHVGA